MEAGIQLIFQKLRHWMEVTIKMLPNFVLALIILGLSLIIARWIRKLTNKIVNRISKSEAVGGLISVIVYSLIVIIGVVTALDVMNLEKTVSSLLAGVGIIGLALGFAFQDLTSNFISGVFMTFKRPFEVGHKIETNGFTGTVNNIHLRSTTLLTSAGLHVIIPNKDIFQKPIINYSKSPDRRVELEFSIPATFDLSYLESAITKAIRNIKNENQIKEVQLFYTGIDNTSAKLMLSFRIDNKEIRGFMNARHAAIIAIHKAFADNGIVKISALPSTPNEVSNQQPAEVH